MKQFIFIFCGFLIATYSVVCNQYEHRKPNTLRDIIHERLEGGDNMMRGKGSSDSDEEDLLEDGIWAKWFNTKHIVPENAVYSGYNFLGPMYVARFINKHGKRRIGLYYPLQSSARYPCYKVNETASGEFILINTYCIAEEFELLLHERYTWTRVNSNHAGVPIRGGGDLTICRAPDFQFLRHFTPGYVSGNQCRIVNNTEGALYNDYDVLTRAC